MAGSQHLVRDDPCKQVLLIAKKVFGAGRMKL